MRQKEWIYTRRKIWKPSIKRTVLLFLFFLFLLTPPYDDVLLKKKNQNLYQLPNLGREQRTFFDWNGRRRTKNWRTYSLASLNRFGSAYIGFEFPTPTTAPHRHWNYLRAPITGIGFVGWLQWQCGTIGAGQLDRCRWHSAQP